MALQIISVVLFAVFFSEALTLMCYNCPTTVPPGTCTQTANCTSPSTQCSSVTTTTNGISSSMKSCSTSCGSVSVNVGPVSYTSQCCASDLCNNATDSSNGKMCYTCGDTNCSTNKTLDCKGIEDKCITAIVTIGGTNVTVKGCASKTVCDNYNAYLPGLGLAMVFNVSCNDTVQRNSAQSLTQRVGLLLVPILPILFSI